MIESFKLRISAGWGMRKLVALSFCFILVFAIVGCSKKKVVNDSTIKISLNMWPGYAYAFVAKEKGFFARNGVDVELAFEKDQFASLNLYRQGRVDGVFTVLADTLILNSQGIPSKAVCVTDYSTEGDVIVARHGINSLEDLRGKVVSFEKINSFSHVFVLKSLEKAGVKESDLRFKDVTGQEVPKAIEKGKIDAGHTWEPAKTEAIRKGYKIVAKASDIPGIIVDVLVFSDKFIQEKPDAVRNIIKALFEAQEFSKANPDEALKIMAEKEGMSESEMRDGVAGVHELSLDENLNLTTTSTLVQSFEAVNSFYLTRGQLVKTFKLTDVFDDRFIREISENK